MGTRLGKLIRSARTDAGYTQEQLARKVKGTTATDIGRFERGEAEPNAQTVKDIAKACGVTQKSLLDAMPKSTSRSTSSRSSSTSTGTKSSMQVNATERRLVELYREATSENKKKALSVLRGNHVDVDDLIAGIGSLIGGSLKK